MVVVVLLLLLLLSKRGAHLAHSHLICNVQPHSPVPVPASSRQLGCYQRSTLGYGPGRRAQGGTC